MRQLSVIMAYYDFIDALKWHVNNWNSFDEDIRKSVHFIVIDDCSPNSPATLTSVPVNVRLDIARIHDNIFFNLPGAKNLGATLADSSWIYFLPCDMVIDNDSMRSILTSELKPNTAYLPERYTWEGSPKGLKSVRNKTKFEYHWCNVVLEKIRFWQIGGMDEDFSGAWGADDSHFARRWRKEFSYVAPWPEVYVRDSNNDAIPGCQILPAIKWGGSSRAAAGNSNASLMYKKMTEIPDHSLDKLRFSWSIEESYNVF